MVAPGEVGTLLEQQRVDALLRDKRLTSKFTTNNQESRIKNQESRMELTG
jgi:hypothetical protein